MMSRLKIELQKLKDRIDELSLRERAMIFVGVLAVLYIAAIQLVISPLAAQRTRLEQDLRNKHNEVQATERQIQAMLTGDVLDADTTKRARIDSLREQLKTLDTELSKSTSGLVAPKDMARLVEQFLANNRGLEVVKVESVAPELLVGESLKTASGQAGAAAGAQPGALVYKHGLRIELRGSYLNMVGYLKGLEALPWRVFWGEVTLQTEKYPVSKMTLLIYTLSTSQSWIAI